MEVKASFLSIIFLSLMLFPCTSNSQTPIILSPSTRIHLPPNTTGPESIVFSTNQLNNHHDQNITDIRFYTSISDGRVLQYVNGNFRDFATTAPNRSKELCDGKSDISLAPICGRPFGLGLDHRSQKIYIADAYFGLMVVGPEGGEAKQLATAAEGIPFGAPNALDIDQKTGLVYFTDATSKYQLSQFVEAVEARDMTGRLLEYNPKTKKVRVLLRNLGIPAGLAVSKDGSYVIFSEYNNNTTKRFWTKTGRSEVFVKLSAPPDNIKMNARGEFWVALNNKTTSFGQKLVVDVGPLRQGRIVQTLIFDVGNETSRPLILFLLLVRFMSTLMVHFMVVL